jgi:hypothetical protein
VVSISADHNHRLRAATTKQLFAPGKCFEKWCVVKSNEGGIARQGTGFPSRVNFTCMLSGLCDQIVYPGTDKTEMNHFDFSKKDERMMRVKEQVLIDILNNSKAANVREYICIDQMSFFIICLSGK